MTPKSILLTLTLSVLTGAQALANPPRYPDPGIGRGGGGRVVPGPVRPGPVRPDPGFPGPIVREPIRRYPPGPIYRPIDPAPIYPAPINRYVQKVIYIGRYVDNETLYLQQLGDLFYSAQGYVLESVEVDARSASYNTILRLLVNGYTEDTDYNAGGYSVLHPSYSRVFGRDLSTLALRLDGSAYVDRITVNLRLDY